MGKIAFVSDGEKSTVLLDGVCMDKVLTGITIKAHHSDISLELEIGELAQTNDVLGKEKFFERASEILGYKLTCEA